MTCSFGSRSKPETKASVYEKWPQKAPRSLRIACYRLHAQQLDASGRDEGRKLEANSRHFSWLKRRHARQYERGRSACYVTPDMSYKGRELGQYSAHKIRVDVTGEKGKKRNYECFPCAFWCYSSVDLLGAINPPMSKSTRLNIITTEKLQNYATARIIKALNDGISTRPVRQRDGTESLKALSDGISTRCVTVGSQSYKIPGRLHPPSLPKQMPSSTTERPIKHYTRYQVSRNY